MTVYIVSRMNLLGVENSSSPLASPMFSDKMTKKKCNDLPPLHFLFSMFWLSRGITVLDPSSDGDTLKLYDKGKGCFLHRFHIL